MKRLLTYLFIVLGLGLTFNVSVEAASYYCVHESVKSKDRIQKIGRITLYEKSMANYFRLSSRPSCYFGSDGKFKKVSSKKYGSLFDYFKYRQLAVRKDINNRLKQTQIAKAEPSQTEKKKVTITKRIDLQLYFCEGAFYNAYLKDYNNGNCEYGKKISYQKFKEKRLIGEGTFDLYYIQSEKPKHQISTLRSCSGLYSNKGDICNKIKYQSGKFYSYGVFDVSDQTQIANKI